MIKVLYANANLPGPARELEIDEGRTLRQMLDEQGASAVTGSSRVSVNGEAIAGDQLDRPLNDRDRILVLAARQDAGAVACERESRVSSTSPERLQRLRLMRKARGMWRDRDDLSPLRELRADWDRGRC